VRQSLGSLTDVHRRHTMPSIFISYSSLDKDRFVNKFAKKLSDKGFTIWVDQWNLKIGEPFWEKIGDAIKASDFIVIILSENSIKSTGVSEELRTAQLFNLEKVKILPIRIDPIDYSQIPLQLRSRHILDFIDWQNKNNFQKKMDKLSSDIMSLYDEN